MWRKCLGKSQLKMLAENLDPGTWKSLPAIWEVDKSLGLEHAVCQIRKGQFGMSRMLTRDVFGGHLVPTPVHHCRKSQVQPLSTNPVKQNHEKEDGTSCQTQRSKIAQDALGTRAWFRKEIMYAPNALSLSRLCAGPVISYWIVSSQWDLAVAGLALAGATDWLDGYLAKKQGRQSVLGSYLDPFADKVLIACTAGALVCRGSLPLWAACTFVARDIFLIAATLLHHSRQARGTGWELLEYIRQGKESELVQPFLVSKVNTAVQLILLSGCLAQGWLGWPGEKHILILSQIAVGTTLMSWGTYVHAYFAGSRAIP